MATATNALSATLRSTFTVDPPRRSAQPLILEAVTNGEISDPTAAFDARVGPETSVVPYLKVPLKRLGTQLKTELYSRIGERVVHASN